MCDCLSFLLRGCHDSGALLSGADCHPGVDGVIPLLVLSRMTFGDLYLEQQRTKCTVLILMFHHSPQTQPQDATSPIYLVDDLQTPEGTTPCRDLFIPFGPPYLDDMLFTFFGQSPGVGISGPRMLRQTEDRNLKQSFLAICGDIQPHAMIALATLNHLLVHEMGQNATSLRVRTLCTLVAVLQYLSSNPPMVHLEWAGIGGHQMVNAIIYESVGIYGSSIYTGQQLCSPPSSNTFYRCD